MQKYTLGQTGKYSLEKLIDILPFRPKEKFISHIALNIKFLKIMDTKIQDQPVVLKFRSIILRS